MKFNLEYWRETLKNLGYTLNESELQIQFLRERRAIPPGTALRQASVLYSDPLTLEIVFLEFESIPSRLSAVKIARYWKEHQQGRQLLLFTDGLQSYAVLVPGLVEDGSSKARILSLSDMLYRTDKEAIESLHFVEQQKSLRERFDIDFLPYEKIRDEFFQGYRNLYQTVYETVKSYLNDNSNSYSQRFLGRLMFLYFLQKKGWLKKDKKFVDSIGGYKELNWVFYQGLSVEGNPGLPYLDGTLFEREEYFTEEIENKVDPEMDQVFQKAREFFNGYNFTVDELSPRDVDVSVDPAMIGTIFEKMLPENERGNKGTFYTPPEETSFICRRSLAAYLGLEEHIGVASGQQVLEDGLSKYIETLRSEKSDKMVREFRSKLLNLRILDPAVGSGGFLLGMMQEILMLIDQAEDTVGWRGDSEEYKKHILPNLFGFDIEGEAIEIARLRLWLSLIVDQKEAEPLPNLDMNIVKVGDSLIKPEGVQSKFDDESLSISEGMKNIRERFTHNNKPAERARLRKEYQKIQDELEKKTGIKGGVIEYWIPDRADIVVMNPPYIRQNVFLVFF